MRRVFVFSAVICLMLIASIAWSKIIPVPTPEHPTIQAGIDAAVDGDTVLAADGIYRGVGNKNLDFQGKAITVTSENGPENCTIDCEDEGKGFIFKNEESEASVVSGFRIESAKGGGISCGRNSSPKIQGNIIADCVSGRGGGIYCGPNSSPKIQVNIITDCVSDQGGGIYCDRNSSPIIQNNNIQNNTITVNEANRSGGGIYCGRNSSPTIQNNEIMKNKAFYDGGGIYCDGTSFPTIQNNLITVNEAARGGGIYCNPKSSPKIQNNTITGNIANQGGGIYCKGSSSPTLCNTIVWGNIPDGIYVDGTSEIDITYSDTQGGWLGKGNIDADPLFVDGYHLSNCSPCISAGTSDCVPPEDIEGNIRGTPPDMGAYENSLDQPHVRIPVKVPLQSWTRDCNVMVFEIATGGSILDTVKAIVPYPHDSYELSFRVPCGVYDISAKQYHRLRRVIRDVTVESGMAVVEFPQLLAGDVNNDNCINFAGDVLPIAAKFGQCHNEACNFVPSDGAPATAWNADINGDMCVDFGDVLLIAANFGKCGEDILGVALAASTIPETGNNQGGGIEMSIAGVRSRRPWELHVPFEKDTFDVILHVKKMTSLYGYALELRYGQGLALIDSMGQAAQEGCFLSDNITGPTIFFAQHDENKHIVRIVGSLTGKHPGVSGSGKIARLQFQRISEHPGYLQLYHVKFVDAAFNYNQMRYSITTPLKVVPSHTQALQNYPNPFNPDTWIPYCLAEESGVQLSIYNQQGKLVRRIKMGNKEPGIYTRPGEVIHWDGRNQQGEIVGSGLYFYHLQAGEFTQVRRMLLLK